MSTLIIGATGNIGTQVVQQLVTDNQHVIAAGRDVKKVKSHFGLSGISFRPFDFTNQNTWQDALEAVANMFLVVPPGSASEEEQVAFFKVAKEMGVQHVVFSSGRSTGPIVGSPLNQTEGFVKNSDMGWTILRPGWFMQNFIEWIGFTISTDNAFYLPAGDSKTAFIDVRDIGAVAAEILTHPLRHSGKMYDLTAAEAIDHFAVAEHLSAVAGRTIRYVPMEEHDFIIKMVEKGRPKKAAEKMASLYSIVREGHEAVVSDDVQNILQRKPIDFEKFARDYAHVWH